MKETPAIAEARQPCPHCNASPDLYGWRHGFYTCGSNTTGRRSMGCHFAELNAALVRAFEGMARELAKLLPKYEWRPIRKPTWYHRICPHVFGWSYQQPGAQRRWCRVCGYGERMERE